MNAIGAGSLVGMQNNLRKFDQHAQKIARYGTTSGADAGETVSLPEEIVGLTMSQRGYEANAMVRKVDDEMVGTLLDTLA